MAEPESTDRREQRAFELFERFCEELGSAAFARRAELIAAHPEVGDELESLFDCIADVDRGLEISRRVHTEIAAKTQETLLRLQDSSRYQLADELGHGGMGVVYRAVDKKLGREVAIKFIRDQDAGNVRGESPTLLHHTVQRFLREADVTSQLDHPGVVPLYDVGIDDRGCVFYTMKLVSGMSLGAKIDDFRRPSLPWKRDAKSLQTLVGVVMRVCETVEHAHDKRIVHRDLKPGNVMVGDYGVVYVVDWGLARRFASSEDEMPERRDSRLDSEAELTSPNCAVGTLVYMSPERCSGRSRGEPSDDVYSIGAILYTVIAGHAPFSDIIERERWSAHERAANIHSRPPTPLGSRSAPPELIAICNKAMARSIVDRFQSVRDLREELQRFIDQRVVPAYAKGALPELVKWIKRNQPLAATVACSVVIALALGMIAAASMARAAGTEKVLSVVASALTEAELWEEHERTSGSTPTALALIDRIKAEFASKQVDAWRWHSCEFADGFVAYNMFRVYRTKGEVRAYFAGNAEVPDNDSRTRDAEGRWRHVNYTELRRHGDIIRILPLTDDPTRG